MKYQYLETTSKRTGEAYYVINSMRGQWFDIVPKKNPATTPYRAPRREFTKPVWKEVEA